MVLWIHLFRLGPVLFHFMKLIEFLMRLSKWTNKLIRNWQMGLYSAVFVCVSMCMHCIKHTLCVCVLWVAGAVYNDVLGCTTLSANLKS